MEKNGFACLRSAFLCLLLIFISFAAAPAAFSQDEVTESIELVKGRQVGNRLTKTVYVDVGLRNIGMIPLGGPVTVIIENLTDLVTLQDADGTTAEGAPYYIYDGELGDGLLDVLETSGARRWTFYNPNNLRFSYTVRVMAGPADETPPDLAVTNPLHGASLGNPSPFITVEYGDDGSGMDLGSFTALLDGQDLSGLFTLAADGARYAIGSPLASGAHVLTVTIADQDGNTASRTVDFTVADSTEPLRYLFSVADNDWIFASAGDGTYVDYHHRGDLGIGSFADLSGVCQVLPGGPLYYTLRHHGGIFQSSADGSSGTFRTSTELGLAGDDQPGSLHVDLDDVVFFSVEGLFDLLQSGGDGTNAFFMQNVQLGLGDGDRIACLHIGYDSQVYFCSPQGNAILESSGDGTHSPFLTASDLGVPDAGLDAFAILPETTPPQLAITQPVNGAFVNSTTPTFTVSFSDAEAGIAESSFQAALDGVDISSLFAVTPSGASCQVSQGSPLAVGSHSLYVSIQDRLGNQSQATSAFSVGILRAIPGATPASGAAPLAVRFSTDGEDPAGTIVAFRWDFDGNGSWDSYDTVAQDYTRTFNTPGTYNARLQVTSSTGATAEAIIQITVLNNPPTATADINPSNGQVPLTVQLIGSGSDPDGSIALYEWDFDGDGTFDWSSATTGTATHTYTTVGSYQAVFRVTDNDGQTATALAATTVVNTGPPGSPTAAALANPSTGNAPLSVVLTGSGTDPDNDIVLYEWDFEGDGTYDWSSPSTGNASHTYTQAGTHVARLRVTDATGLTGIDQVTVQVNIQTSLSIAKNTVGFLSNLPGMTASASTQYSSYYPPSKAVDENAGSYWHSAYNGASPGSWFQVAFDAPQRVFGCTVNWYSTSYQMRRATVELYDATDALIHSEEVTFSGNPSTADLSTVVDNVSRLRLVTITSSSSYLVIREFIPESQNMAGVEQEPDGTHINTSISADSPVTIFLKDGLGNTVRTLVNNQFRTLGSYQDYWDCRDDHGVLVNDGVYYAVMQYVIDGEVKTYDLTQTTGGTRASFPTGTSCNSRNSMAKSSFAPYEDDFCPITFRLCDASEVTVFIGPLNTGGSETRIRTILNRKALPAGEHTIYWDGLNDQGDIAHPPPGDALILGMWRYSLPTNAVYMTGTRPVISSVRSEPNYFNPLSNTCLEYGNAVDVSFAVSEAVQSVDLQVIDLETKSTVRVVRQFNLPSGPNHIYWDGRTDSGDFVEAGDYQLVLTATDAEGNNSMLTTANLVRLTY